MLRMLLRFEVQRAILPLAVILHRQTARADNPNLRFSDGSQPGPGPWYPCA